MQDYKFKTIKFNINNKNFLLDIEFIYIKSDKSIVIIEISEKYEDGTSFYIDSYINYSFGDNFDIIYENLINKAMMQILEYCEII